MASHSTSVPGTDVTRRPLRLVPFRGLRFDPAVVGDLSTVISPPYDVLDAETVRRLEHANRRNIVRLILSRRFERPYVAVRERLAGWRERGFLRPDEEPALYLYEYSAEQVTVRGLIGLVALREEAERVILPHEDVMDAPVADRAVLMRTTRTNLEPILLVHAGTASLQEMLAEVAATPPLVDSSALDGSCHRLWLLRDPALLDSVATELAPSQALIADGHHRYAAYLRLQAELRDEAAPREASPWDFGLAMLVDQNDQALRVGPIHRSVAALTLADLRELSEERGDTLEVHPDRETALGAWSDADPDPEVVTFAVSDGEAWAVLRTKRTSDIDAAVLHQDLFTAWHVAEDQIGYHHSLDQALHTTQRQPALVVAVRPPTLPQVMEAAAQGVRLPRKSTSFSPKPRMGVVMRDLRDA